MADQPRETHPAISFLTGTLPLLLPAVYAIGFVAVNARHAQFGTLPLPLLAPQYLSAALLFIVVALPSAYIGSTATWDEAELEGITDEAAAKRTIRRASYRVVLAQLLGAFAAPLVMAALNAGAGLAFRLESYGGALILGFLAAKAGHQRIRHIRDLLAQKAQDRLHASLLRQLIGTHTFGVIVFVFVLAALFGRLVYPSVTSGLGGGAAWQVAIVLTTDSAGTTQLDGLLVDQSEANLLIATCADSLHDPLGLLLPSSRVQAIRYVRQVIIAPTLASVCATRE